MTVQPHSVLMTKTGGAISPLLIYSYFNDVHSDKFSLVPDIKVNENFFRDFACTKICLLLLKCKLDIGKVMQKNQLDATIIY